MAAIIRGDRAGYLYSGKIPGMGTASSLNWNPSLPPEDKTAWIDARGSERFLFWVSASSDGPTAGASSVMSWLHSHDKVHITRIGVPITASAGTAGSLIMQTGWYSGGPYSWITLRVDLAWSAAQTGTAHLFAWVMPSPR